MERRARSVFWAASLTMVVACSPVWAKGTGQQGQTQPGTSTTTQTTTTTTTTTTEVVNDPYNYLYATDLPVGADAEAVRLYAMQQIADAGITGRDIIRILPLMLSLRDLDQSYRWREGVLESRLLSARHGEIEVAGQKSTGTDRLARLDEGYRERRARIWETVADRIGADKAGRLRALVDWPANRNDMTAYWNGIRDIDTTLARWDALAAARVAGNTSTTTTTTTTTENPTTGQSTTETATVETTARVPIDQVTFNGPAIPAILSQEELVTILQDRLVALNATPETSMVIDVRRSDLTDPMLTYMRNERNWMWK